MISESDNLSVNLSKLKVENNTGSQNFSHNDSDITPTNSPHAYSSSIFFPGCSSTNTSGFYDGDFGRFAGSEEFDTRSNSSMSWGEDEFEGEATRIVTSLFEQLDRILYDENIVPSNEKPLYIPLTTALKNKAKKKKRYPKSKTLSVKDRSKSNNTLVVDEAIGISSRVIQPSEPSSNLIDECSTWVENFPYFRLKGHGVNILRLDHLEAIAFEDEEFLPTSNIDFSEEIIDQHGDYGHLMHYTNLNNSVSEDKHSKSSLNKKSTGPPSRIYSGSSDPEVIKEQVLIALFDSLWPVATQIVEPLLNSYAQSVINQSIHLSSFSREQSSKSKRETNFDSSLQLDTNMQSLDKRYQPFDYLNKEILTPQINYQRVTDQHLVSNFKQDSIMGGLRRNMSAQHRIFIPSEISEKEITEVFPLNFKAEEENYCRRSSSASLFSNRSEGSQFMEPLLSSRTVAAYPSVNPHVSLPFLGKNLGSISSRQPNSDAVPLATLERRPASTSSFMRLRLHDKFSMSNRESTIDEGRNHERQYKEGLRSELPAARSFSPEKPPSFLPPISNSNKQTSSSSSKMLNVRGVSLSARTRTPLRQSGTNIDPWKHAEPYDSISKGRTLPRSMEKTVQSLSSSKISSSPLSESSRSKHPFRHTFTSADLPLVRNSKHIRRFSHH